MNKDTTPEGSMPDHPMNPDETDRLPADQVLAALARFCRDEQRYNTPQKASAQEQMYRIACIWAGGLPCLAPGY